MPERYADRDVTPLSQELRTLWALAHDRETDRHGVVISKAPEIDATRGRIRELIGDDFGLLDDEVETYARQKQLSFGAARIRLLSALGNEFREWLESDIADYLVDLDLASVMRFDDEELKTDTSKTLKIIFDENYGDLLAIRAVYRPYIKNDIILQDIFAAWRRIKKAAQKQMAEVSEKEKHRRVIELCTPKVAAMLKATMQNRRRRPYFKQMCNAIYRMSLCFEAVRYFNEAHSLENKYGIKKTHPHQRFDCNDKTLFAIAASFQQGDRQFHPVFSDGHVGIELVSDVPMDYGEGTVSSATLVFDTYELEGRVRTAEEFARFNSGKGSSEEGAIATKQGNDFASYYYQDRTAKYHTGPYGMHKWHVEEDAGCGKYALLADILISEACNVEWGGEFNDGEIIKGQINKAEMISKMAHRIDPENARVMNNIAIYYVIQGYVEEALKVWDMAIAADPLHATSYREKAICLQNNFKGNREYEAEELYRKCLGLNWHDAVAANNLALIMLNRLLTIRWLPPAAIEERAREIERLLKIAKEKGNEFAENKLKKLYEHVGKLYMNNPSPGIR